MVVKTDNPNVLEHLQRAFAQHLDDSEGNSIIAAGEGRRDPRANLTSATVQRQLRMRQPKADELADKFTSVGRVVFEETVKHITVCNTASFLSAQE